MADASRGGTTLPEPRPWLPGPTPITARSLAGLLAAAVLLACTTLASAQQIVPSGHTATELAVSGNVTDVTTGTRLGRNGYNSFSTFDVYTGNIVNLHLPAGADNLLNVVLDRSTRIDGVLNSVKDGAIGGNVFFANPHGIIVGEAGVLNVGSLHLSTPTPEFAARLVPVAGAPDPVISGQMLAGQIPVSAMAPITVQGTINVVNDATVAAGQVANQGVIQAGAVFVTTRIDFGDVVNIAGLETAAGVATGNGAVRIVAAGDLVNTGTVRADGADGRDAGRVELLAGGDISLSGEARVSASGRGTDSAGGEVLVLAGGNARLADRAVLAATGGEVSGDGGFVEFSARDTVILAGGSLQAGATAGAGGTVLIDPENLTVATDLLRAPGDTNPDGDGITWTGGNLVLQADDTLTVADGVLISTRNVGAADRASHIGGVSVGPSGNLRLEARRIVLVDSAQLLAQGGNGHAGGDIRLQAGASAGSLDFGTVSAAIELGSATVRGANLDLTATANLGSSLPVVVREVAATVTIDGALLEASGTLSLSAGTAVALSTPAFVPFGTVDVTARAGIDVGGDSVLRTLAGGAATLAVGSSFDVSVTAGLPDLLELPFDAGVAVALLDSTAELRLRGNSELDIAGTLDLVAGNALTVLAATDAGANGATAAGGAASVAILDVTTSISLEDSARISQASALTATAVTTVDGTVSARAATDGAVDQGTDGAGNARSQTQQVLADYDDQAQTGDGGVQVAAAVAVSDISSLTRIVLGSAQTSSVSGPVALGTRSAVGSAVSADGSAAAGGVGVGVGVAINLAEVSNEASVAQALNAGGLTLTALNDLAGEGNRFSSEAVSGAGASDVGVAGSLAVNVISTGSAAMLGGAALVGAGGQAVLLEAGNTTVSTASATPADGGATGDTLGIGASVAVNVVSNRATAELGPGSQLSGAGGLSLLATGDYTQQTAAEAGAEGGIGLTPVVAVTVADNRTLARLASGPALTLGGNLVLVANHGGSTTTSAAAEAAGDKVAVGAAVAVNVVSDEGLVAVLRNVTSTAGGFGLSVTSRAASEATAKASAKGGKEETEGETPDDGVDQEVGKQLTVGRNQQKGDSANQDQQPGSAETSEGKLSVAAAIAVNIADSVARALVGDGLSLTATGPLVLAASNNTDASAGADGSAAGSTAAVGIGAAVGVNKVRALTEATLGDGEVTANGLSVTAGMTDAGGDTTNSFGAEATSGAGAGKVGIAGALALNLIEVRSRATIGAGAAVDAAGGDVVLRADSASSTTAKAVPAEDGGASGGEVGVGASAAVNTFSADQTRAAIGQDATVENAGNLSLTATSASDTRAEAKAGAEGSVAIDAVVAFSQVRQRSEAVIESGDEIIAAGMVSLSATATGEHSAEATGDVESGKVGVGASAAVILSETLTRAALERDLTAGDGDGQALVLAASASRSYEAVAYASAAGSKDEDELTDDGKDKARSTSTLKDNQDSQQGTQGGSKVNVAAAAGVLVLDDDVAVAIGAGRQIRAFGGIDLSATSSTDFSARGRGDTLDITKIGNTQVGIGVGVGLAIVRNDTTAEVGAGTHIVQAGDIMLAADSRQNTGPDFVNKLAAEAVSGAGSEKVSVAGSLAVANSNATTEARLGAGVVIGEAGAVSLTADNTSKLSAKAWSGALSNKVGVGASVATVVSTNAYRAVVGADAEITAASLTVAARNHKVTGSVPFSFDFSLDGASFDTFEDKLSEQNLQILLGENNYYTEALAGAGGGQVAVTGAFAVNVFDDTTEAAIGDRATVTADGAVSLTATSDTTAKAFAGALAAGKNAGVGLNSADIVNEGRTRAWLGNSARIEDSVATSLQAFASLDFGVFGASLGAANTAGVAGVLALVLADNEVAAWTGNGSGLRSRGDALLEARSEYTSLMVAGGAGGGNTAGIGASAATNMVETRTRAEVGSDADVKVAGTLTVDAAATETTRTIAVAGGAASTAGVGAGVTVNVIEPEITALIAGGARVNVDQTDPLLRGQRVLVSASGHSSLLAIAGGVGAAGTAGIGAGVDVGVIGRSVEARIAADAEVRASEEIRVTATSSDTVFSIGAAAGGGGTLGLSGAAAGHSLTSTTRSLIAGDATVHSFGNVVVSASSLTDLSLIAGGAALGGTAGIGLSAGVLVLDKTVEAFVGDNAVVTAWGAGPAPATVPTGAFDVAFTAYDPARRREEVQGPGADQFTGQAAGAGGDLLTQQRSASPATGALRGLAVTATSQDEIRAIAAAGGLGGTVAVTFGGAVGVLGSVVEARVGEGAVLNPDNSGAHPDQSLLVAAAHDLYHLGLGGSASGAGVVGLGAGADVMVIDLVTGARIGAGATARVRRDVDVLASARQDLLSVAGAAGVGGTVGIAGAVGAVVVNSATGAAIGADAVVDADGNVRVVARDDTEVILVAGSVGIGIGAVGIGGSVGVTSLSKDTVAAIGDRATVNARGGLVPPPADDSVVPTPPDLEDVEAIEVDPGEVVADPQAPPEFPDTTDLLVYTGENFSQTDTARGLLVQATSREDVLAIAAAGSGGLFAGVSGAVTFESIRSRTRAWIGADALINVANERANARQDVNVTARNEAELLIIDGSLAIGPLGAGVAGSVDVGLIRNDTSAWIGAGAVVNANRDIDVNALARKEIDSYVVSAAGGIVGLAAGIGVYSLGAPVDADARGRLQPEGSDETANGYADGQVRDGSVTGALGNYGNDRLAAIGSRAGAARAGVAISGQLTASPPSGTSAWIGEGALLSAGRHLDLDARDDVALGVLAGAVGGGVVGFGAGVTVATVNTNSLAFVADGATLAAGLLDGGGDVSVTALLNSASGAESCAGSGGVVAVDAAVAVFTDNSTIAATLGSGVQVTNARQVRLEAFDRRSQVAEALGASVGAATAGVALATTTVGGSVSAAIGPSVQIGQGTGSVGELVLLADSAALGRAEATSARAGLGLAASGSVGTSTVGPTVSATIGAGSHISTGQGTVVSALAAPRAVAEATGVNVSAGVSIGASVATATASPQVSASVGNAVEFGNGTLSVLAQNRPADGTDSAFARAIGASGGLLVGASATIAEASSASMVAATLGNGVRLPTGDVIVRANNYSRQRALGLGLSLGFVAVGANDVEAESTNSTLAGIGTGTVTSPGRLGAIAVVADGQDQNIAGSTAGSGGVVAGNASFAATRDFSTVSAAIGGGATLYTGSLLLDASHTDNYAPSSDSLNAAAVGASGAFARHTANSVVGASLGTDLTINAAGPVAVAASNTYTDTGSGERASGAAGGVASGAAVGSATTFLGNANVSLGDRVAINSGTDPVLNPGGIALIAATFLTADEQVSLVTGGLLAGAVTQTRLNATIASSVTTGTANELVSQGSLGIGTFAQVLATTASLVNTWGLAAVGSADSANTIVSNQSVSIGGNSFLQGATNVDLTAGKDPTGFYDTLISATSSAQGYVRGVIAVPLAEADTRITSNASMTVGAGTIIRSGQNTTLGAYKGTPLASADGTGRGFELGFIPVTERNSHTSVSTSAVVVHNGAITAGIYNLLDLEIPNCQNDGIFCSTLTVLNPDSAPPFVSNYLPGFSPADFVNANFSGTSAQLLLSGVSSTPVAAFSLGTLFVAGGQAILHADTLAGSGAVTARGGPRISINNLSPDYLILGPVLIPNTPGGRVLFTGGAGLNQAGNISISEINPGQAPVIEIYNRFNGPVGTTSGGFGPALFVTGPVQNLGGLIRLENVSGSLGQIATIFGQQVQITVPSGVAVISIPDGTYYVSGTPYDQWSNFMIWPGGNPAAGSPNANQAAAWAANYYAATERGGADIFINSRLYGFAGSADNNSYVFYGFCAAFALSSAACSYQTATSLSPVGAAWAISSSDFNERWFPAIPVLPLTRSAANYSVADLTGSQQGAAIYGGQVAIEARYVDINSRIIAGQPTDWSVLLPASLTAGPGFGNPQGGAIYRQDQLYAAGLAGPTLALGSLPLLNPALDQRIQATYDARTGQITLSDVSASSGGARVSIDGIILSTSPFGQILINGGLGTVNIRNDTGRELVLQTINTGNTALAAALENRVQIIDRGRDPASNQWLYLYSPADGLRVFNGAQNAELGSGTPIFSDNVSSYWFDPVPNLRWEWQLQAQLARQVSTTSTGILSSISGWNWVPVEPMLDANDPWRYTQVNPATNQYVFGTTKTPTGRLVTQAIPNVFQQTITAIGYSFFVQGVNYHGCGSTTCNFGFARTGTYTSGERNGQGFGLWRYRYARAATLVMTMSAKADNSIGVDFAGNPRGTINIISNGPVSLAGQILNPNGETTIVTGGSLLAAGGSLLTDNGWLTATGSIGTPGLPLPLTSSGGVLHATAGRDGLYLDLNSGALLGTLVAGSVGSGFGDVVVRAAGDLLRAPGLPAGQLNVIGRNISLASELGAIGDFGTSGFDGTPLLLGAQPTLLLNGGISGGEVSARAQTDIALRQPAGQLLLGVVESTAAGNVFLSAGGASLLSASGQTASQALDPDQVRQIWQDLRLTADFGAELPGDPAARSVQDYQVQVERDYARYWQLLTRGTVEAGEFVLAEDAIRLFRPVTAANAGVPDPSDAQVRDYAAAVYGETVARLQEALGVGFAGLPAFQAYDPDFRYQASGDQVAALTARALWTEGELSAAINRTALEPAAGTPVGVGTPNVIGRNVVLDTAGAIGRLAEPVFVGLTDLQAGNLTSEQAAALALAFRPGDVIQVGEDGAGNTLTFEFGQQPPGVTLTGFLVAQTSPLFVDAAGAFRATSGGEAFIQSAGQILTLDQVLAAGDVSLTAPLSILSAGTSPVQISTGGDLTLLAGGGSIGASALDPLVVEIGGRLLAASANQNIYLRAVAGDLVIGRMFAGQTAWLDVTGGSLRASLPGVTVEAGDMEFVVQGDLGAADQAFGVEHGPAGRLDGTVGGSTWLFAPTADLAIGSLGSGQDASVTGAFDLTIADLSAGGALNLTALGNLSIDGSAVAATDVTASAGGRLTMSDGALLAATSGSLSVEAGDDITLGRLVSGGTGDVLVTSGGAILDGGDTGGADIDAPAARLVIEAAGGIGAGNALETRVTALRALVTGAGHIGIANIGALRLENATAVGNVAVATSGGMAVERVRAVGGDASLLAGGSLLATGPLDEPAVVGRSITLEAPDGDIGTGPRWFSVDSASDAPGVVRATANGSIWLEEAAGDLTVDAILAAVGNLQVRAAGSILGAVPGLHLAGASIGLESLAGAIGEPALRLGADSRVLLNATAATGIWLEEVSGDLRSDFLRTTAGSIDILVREGNGEFGEVLAPDTVTIVAKGTLLSIGLLDPAFAYLAVTSPGSRLHVAEGYLGTYGQFNGDYLAFPNLVHTDTIEPLRLSVSGHDGGLAEEAEFMIHSIPGVIFDPLLVRTADITVTGELLELIDSRVVSRGFFRNGSWTVLVDNVNRRLFPVDVQLYSAARPTFGLRMTSSNRIDTTALAINYQPWMLVNGFSTENSLTRLVAKMLAIAEDADAAPRDPGADIPGPAAVDLPPELPLPAGNLADPAGVRVTL